LNDLNKVIPKTAKHSKPSKLHLNCEILERGVMWNGWVGGWYLKPVSRPIHLKCGICKVLAAQRKLLELAITKYANGVHFVAVQPHRQSNTKLEVILVTKDFAKISKMRRKNNYVYCLRKMKYTPVTTQFYSISFVML
jgi:hypothetical protein